MYGDESNPSQRLSEESEGKQGGSLSLPGRKANRDWDVHGQVVTTKEESVLLNNGRIDIKDLAPCGDVESRPTQGSYCMVLTPQMRLYEGSGAHS